MNSVIINVLCLSLSLQAILILAGELILELTYYQTLVELEPKAIDC